MKITKTILHHDQSRDTYWAKLRFVSEDNVKRSSVLLCASCEYLDQHSKLNNQSKLEGWYEGVIREWKDKGESLFTHTLYYDIRATTDDGAKNGRYFLEQKA